MFCNTAAVRPFIIIIIIIQIDVLVRLAHAQKDLCQRDLTCRLLHR